MTTAPTDPSDRIDLASLLGAGDPGRTIASLCCANAELGALVVGLMTDREDATGDARSLALLKDCVSAIGDAMPADLVDPPTHEQWVKLRNAIGDALGLVDGLDPTPDPAG